MINMGGPSDPGGARCLRAPRAGVLLLDIPRHVGGPESLIHGDKDAPKSTQFHGAAYSHHAQSRCQPVQGESATPIVE